MTARLVLFSAFSLAICLDATATLVTSRAAINGDDFLDFGALGPAGTQVSLPLTLATDLGNQATIDELAPNATFRSDSLNGFASLYVRRVTSSNNSSGGAEIRYAFDFATPVQAVGGDFLVEANRPVRLTFTARSANGVTFESVFSPDYPRNEISFKGFRSNTEEGISSLEIHAFMLGIGQHDLAVEVNRLSIQSIPEPSLLIGFAATALMTAIVAMRRAK